MRPRVLLVLALLAVAGCGERPQGGGAAEAPAEPLWGKTFLLDSATEGGEPKALVAGTEVSVGFTDDQRLVANAGCNTMTGPAALEGGRLATDGLATTEMGCDPPRHAQDEWLAAFLDGGPSWELADERLVLRGGDTELTLTDKAVAEPALPLVGTVWTVASLLDGGTAASTPAGAPPATVEFGTDRVEVFTGCNSGSAGYRSEGGTITVDALVLTRKACGGDIMRVESAVVGVLEGAVAYAVESDVLTLEHPSGKGLQLRAE